MFKARAKQTIQLLDVVEHKATGTLKKGTVVDVLRRHPKAEHVVIFHEGEVHAVYKHHFEMV